MKIETTKVVEALTKVTDPKSGQDIITMSMVRDLKEGAIMSIFL